MALDRGSSGKSSVRLGRAVIGDAAFQAQKKKIRRGGAIVLGKAILGQQSAAEKAKAAVVRAAPVVDEAEKPVSRVAESKVEPKAAVEAVPGIASMTEQEVRKVLKADANQWEQVLALETHRPGGIRLAVATAILATSKKAKANPLTDTVRAQLQTIIDEAK